MTIEDISKSPHPLPNSITWLVVALCALPTFLTYAPIFGSFTQFTTTEHLSQLNLELLHNLIEGCAFFVALFTVILSLVHFSIRSDLVTPVIGISLFASSIVDVFHLLATNNLLYFSGDSTNLAPITWTISRMAMSLICLFGIMFVYWYKPKQIHQSQVKWVIVIGALLGTIAILTAKIIASQSLPQAIYRDSLFVRPWDLIPLFTFGLSSIVFLNFYRNYSSTFSHALIISVIPNFTSQLHMALGSESGMDYHGITAHILKIVAYTVPLCGLLLDYIRTYKNYEIVVDKLNKESEAKSRFVANISHELRTPMNAVIGAAELLKDNTQSVKEKKYISTIITAGETLTHIVDDLLDLSKIQSKKLILENRTIDLFHTINDCVELFKPKAEQKSIELKLINNCDLPLYVMSDEVRIKQLIYNLLSNAIKFTHQGSVEVSISRNNNEMFTIRVSDTGIGIPADKQKTIFDQFVQADDSTTRKYGGTGLGLAIVKNLVELFNGSIDLKSENNAGSVFTVQLPLKTVAQLVDNSPKEVKINQHHTLPVLIVDDVSINRDLVVEFLQTENLNTAEAESAEQAIEKVKKLRFSAILMDMQMPGMDGLTATKLIREWEKLTSSPRTPIIAFTANAETDNAKLALSFGCDYYVMKPIRKSDLITAINTVTMEKKHHA